MTSTTRLWISNVFQTGAMNNNALNGTASNQHHPRNKKTSDFKHGKAVFDTHINRRMIIIDPGSTKGQVIH